MPNINKLISAAEKAGFEVYGSFNEGEDVQHDILTCTNGQYSGEVIDVYYGFYTGDVSKVEQSCQFPATHPHYAPVKYVIPV